MKRKKVVIFFAGLFLLLWAGAFWSIHIRNSKYSPVSRTAWTLRVVKVVDHIVKKGESLTKIAEKYGVPLQDILKVNAIEDSDTVKAGEKIKIPLSKVKGEVLI